MSFGGFIHHLFALKFGAFFFFFLVFLLPCAKHWSFIKEAVNETGCLMPDGGIALS